MAVYDNALQNGWQNYGWATINYANTSPVHGGSDSISVTDPGASHQALYLHHSAIDPSLYQSLSFWIYPTAAGTNQLHVQATLNGNAQPAVNLSFTAAQANQWQQETISLASLKVAGNATFDGFWIQNNTGGPLTFYVDDISLIAIPPPNPVPLAVDAQSVIRTIDSRIAGINLAIWDGNLGGAATTGILTAMGTQVLRFPGGSASDDYDWQTDRSVDNGTFQWVNYAAAFARVAETRGAQAYVTVNYGSGTPEQAAAWVAYYNASAASTMALGTDAKGRDWKTAGYWAALRGSAPPGENETTATIFFASRIPRPLPFAIGSLATNVMGVGSTISTASAAADFPGSRRIPIPTRRPFSVSSARCSPSIPPSASGRWPRLGRTPTGTARMRSRTRTRAIRCTADGRLRSSPARPFARGDRTFSLIHVYPQNPGNESDCVVLLPSRGFHHRLGRGESAEDDYRLRQPSVRQFHRIGGDGTELGEFESGQAIDEPRQWALYGRHHRAIHAHGVQYLRLVVFARRRRD